MKKKLPLGIQNFCKIHDEGCYYVDKTAYIHRLIEAGSYYFLSRPRRFGKSLLVDTIQEVFEGNKKLFKGLYIHDKWNWSKKYPVIKISFGGGVLKSREELEQKIKEILDENAKKFNVIYTVQSISGKLRELIIKAKDYHGEQAVVLVDEYDKPILDNIENSDIALEMREGLKNFYSPIKEADAFLKFVFLTGVSKFSKVSLFSGLNNLTDITLDQRYGAICGYTQTDVETIFEDQILELDKDEIRDWYNGYNWLGESVYNPYDLLLLFDKRKFRPYWFETGTPTFLVKLLKERKTWLPGINDSFSTEKLLSTFDVDNIPTEALMFQAGYLTINSYQEIPGRLEINLKYPNKEVMTALNETLLWEYVGVSSLDLRNVSKAHRALLNEDCIALKNQLYALYASIPYQWHIKNNIAEYEGYYASVFYAFFASLGLDIACEESSHAGRLDIVVRLNKIVYIFEFKIIENNSAGSALQQIKDKGYANKYLTDSQEVYLIGIEFSKEKRQIQMFEWEKS